MFLKKTIYETTLTFYAQHFLLYLCVFFKKLHNYVIPMKVVRLINTHFI